MSQTEIPSRRTVIGIGIGLGIGTVISHLLFDGWVGLPWSLLGVAIVTHSGEDRSLALGLAPPFCGTNGTGGYPGHPRCR
jgi:hypothetical protein